MEFTKEAGEGAKACVQKIFDALTNNSKTTYRVYLTEAHQFIDASIAQAPPKAASPKTADFGDYPKVKPSKAT